MIESANFQRLIKSLPGITKEEESVILESFNVRQLEPKEYFCREGEICKQLGYVDKGCLSYFQVLADGRKSIIHFAFEDWWTGDLESFLTREPGHYNWQAIEPVELICISRSKFDILRNEYTAFNGLFYRKTQTAYIKAMAKAAKDKSETAEEKYLRMLEEQPQIIQRVPHYDVAAYLGIAPESLSRIRNKLSKEK